MTKLTDKPKNLSEKEAGFFRKIVNIPIGFTLGTTVFGVSMLRAGLRMATKSLSGIAGVGATTLATGAHLFNFIGFQSIKGINKIIGKDSSHLSVKSTADLVTKTAQYTKKQFKDAASAVPYVFSGEADKKYRKLLKDVNLPNTREWLKIATRTTLSLPNIKDKGKLER